MGMWEFTSLGILRLLGIIQGLFIQEDNRWLCPNTLQKVNVVILI